MGEHAISVDQMIEDAARAMCAADMLRQGAMPTDTTVSLTWRNYTPVVRRTLESLGLPLSVLAALKAGTWQAVPKKPAFMQRRQLMLAVEYAVNRQGGDATVDELAPVVWECTLAAAPITPEAS